MADIAGKEYSIEVALDKMFRDWESTEMSVLDYRETGTYIIKVEDQVSVCVCVCVCADMCGAAR